ncbi:atrial natriuretic peptide receptor 1-like [Paramacrobiotus metropolitanus]|uniref:atrial natriuretic peptide receptor 1-like n=1 Tax=Paramacrobiotus metropolitanus TaxID=2943436 RepID=UPI0024456340|nr:atrial natriuretic peptide receptor 1-like [Paramacrobiotus metropolitanus]
MYYWDCVQGFQWYFWDNQFIAGNAYRPKLTTRYIEENTTAVLEAMRQHVRIIYVMVLPKLLRKILISASDMNMTSGDFVFIAAYRQPSYSTPDPLDWKALHNDSYDSEAEDRKALQGFQCTIIISDLGIDWDNLQNFTNRSAEMSEVLLNRTIPPKSQKDATSVLFLEVISVFLQGLQRLRPVLDYLTPSDVITDLLNHTYNLPSRQIKFVPNGKNAVATPIVRLNISSGRFEIAASCSYDNYSLSVIQPALWAWFGGQPYPPDVPRCGFDKHGCAILFVDEVNNFLQQYINVYDVMLRYPNSNTRITLGKVLREVFGIGRAYNHGPANARQRYSGVQLNDEGAAEFINLMGYDMYAD